jgi:hypothetical protein
MISDQFDPGLAQRIDDPGQGFDNAADGTDARFHPLNRWQRETGQFGKPSLVNSQQGPSRLHLERRDHAIILFKQ